MKTSPDRFDLELFGISFATNSLLGTVETLNSGDEGWKEAWDMGRSMIRWHGWLGS